MNTPQTTPRGANARRGNILVMAVILLGGAMALITQSGESVTGSYTLMRTKLYEQKALAAAEAVAARQEALLGDNFFNINKKDSTWLDAAGNQYGQRWYGDCQVKWRLEPVQVTELKTPGATGTKYVVNPDPDPNATLPSGDEMVNQDIYHYRIATEATYFEKNFAGQEVAKIKAQAVRVVQLSSIRLFKYAIFYGQKGARGDIEFAHGPDLKVLGGVHSNGAIYLGGASGPTSSNIGNVNTGGKTIIGEPTPANNNKKVTVTAVDGIYLMNKRYNYFWKGGVGYAGADPDNPDPMKIKDPQLFNVQGNRTINLLTITKDKDSRGDNNFQKNSIAPAPVGWGGWLRTSKTGAVVVNSLSNIPDFVGRPLEPQRLSDMDAPVLPNPPQEYTRKPICYDGGNPHKPKPVTDQSAANADMKYAANGPYLDYALGAKEFGGYSWTDWTAVTNGYVMHCHRINELTGITEEVIPDKVGLVIRERPKGLTGANPAWNDPGIPPVPGETPADAVTYAAAKQAYATYMKSEYQVFLGRLDITDAFFDYPTYAQATVARKYVPAGTARGIATQDFFYNQREYYSQGSKAWANTSIQRQSVLTINMDALQDFLRDTTLAQIPAYAASGGTDPHANNKAYLTYKTGGAISGNIAPITDTLRQHFSGLLYAHRFNRSGAYSSANNPADFSAGIRIARGADISWDHDTGNNKLGTSKLTIVTPNQAFLQGDFNTKTYPTGEPAPKDQAQTPLAIMCDMLTVQSNNFTDANQNTLATAGSPSTGWRGAATTTYNTALVLNNAPTVQAYKYDDASVHTFAWYMENWSGTTYNFKGSIVVINSRRYCRGFNQGAPREATPSVDMPPGTASPAPTLYGAPTRNITFNEDLMTNEGTPPYVLPAYAVSRQVSYSYVVMAR